MILACNEVVLVDDCDFHFFHEHTWFVHEREEGRKYVGRTAWNGQRQVRLRLHTAIMRPPNGMVVDHINGDTLDNRRSNLRVCTHKQNLGNRRPNRNSPWRYKGVRKRNDRNKWVASLAGKTLGYFDHERDAAEAYNAAAVERYGEFARLNEI